MKSVCVCALLLLASVSVAQAQVAAPKPVFDTDNAAPDFSATSAAKGTLPDLLAVTDSLLRAGINSTPSLSTALPAEPAATAEPAAPSPKPRFVYGGRDDYRWQLGLSLAFVRFNSSAFNFSASVFDFSASAFLPCRARIRPSHR